MPDTFVSMHAWLTRDERMAVDAIPEPHAPMPSNETAGEDAPFEDLCSELRRFRAALLDALACANDGRAAELRIRCGTIDVGIDIGAQRLREALQ